MKGDTYNKKIRKTLLKETKRVFQISEYNEKRKIFFHIINCWIDYLNIYDK